MTGAVGTTVADDDVGGGATVLADGVCDGLGLVPPEGPGVAVGGASVDGSGLSVRSADQ